MVIFMQNGSSNDQVNYVIRMATELGYEHALEDLGGNMTMISVYDTEERPADTVSFARIRGVGRVLDLKIKAPCAVPVGS